MLYKLLILPIILISFTFRFLLRTLIENGLINLLGDIGWRWKQLPPLIVDDSNSSLILDPEINAKNCFQVGLCSKTIMDHVKPECEGDNFPLILGGDHCISIGTISAIKSARKNTAVVWVTHCSHSVFMHLFIYIFKF